MYRAYQIAPLWSSLGGRVACQRLTVHSGHGEAEMAQGRRGDVDERRTVTISARGKAPTRDEQERALLVSAETAMLAKAGAVLRFERIADDVAMTGHSVSVGTIVGLER